MGPGSPLGDVGAAINSFIFGPNLNPPGGTNIGVPGEDPGFPLIPFEGPAPGGPVVEPPDITPTLTLPTEEKVSSKEAANAEMERRRKRRGTTFTGPGGILTPAPTKKATLG